MKETNFRDGHILGKFSRILLMTFPTAHLGQQLRELIQLLLQRCLVVVTHSFHAVALAQGRATFIDAGDIFREHANSGFVDKSYLCLGSKNCVVSV